MKTKKDTKKCPAACTCGGAISKEKGGKEERTTHLKFRMTPSVKDRTIKLFDDICALEEEKLSGSDLWEYLFLPTLETMTKEAKELRAREKKAEAEAKKAEAKAAKDAAKAKKASGKKVSVKKANAKKTGKNK